MKCLKISWKACRLLVMRGKLRFYFFLAFVYISNNKFSLASHMSGLATGYKMYTNSSRWPKSVDVKCQFELWTSAFMSNIVKGLGTPFRKLSLEVCHRFPKCWQTQRKLENEPNLWWYNWLTEHSGSQALQKLYRALGSDCTSPSTISLTILNNHFVT